MKIIQMTDLHYGGKNEAIYHKEPAMMLRLAIEDINKNHGDADFVFLTGDLAHRGSVEAYAYLKEDLDALAMPYYLVLGNHDSRKNALKIFENLREDENGFIQYALEFQNEVFLMLDTLQEVGHGGEYCVKRRAWLRGQLERYGGKNIYLCLHHAPFATGLRAMDKIGLRQEDAEDLYAILQPYDGVRHLFFGHYHSTMCGRWGKFSFSSLKGINHQVRLDFQSEDEVFIEFRNPEYSLILIENEVLNVHFRDFSHQSQALRED